MKPTQSDVHVNGPLGNILVAFMQDEKDAIADKAFPIVPVAKKTDLYYRWSREDFWRVSAKERAPGTQAEVGGITNDTDSYDAKEYAVRYDIPDALRDNADSELSLDEAATRYIGHQLMLKREQVWNTTYFKTSLWTGAVATNGGSGGADVTGTTTGTGADQFKQWDLANSTPIEDLRRQILGVKSKTGHAPNKLILGPEVWNVLVDHAELLERIKYTQKAMASTDLLASLLGLDEVLIGSLVYNSAAEGVTASYGFMHGKSALLLYAPKAPSRFAPSAGYTFTWTTRFGAGAQGQRVKRYYQDTTESTVIEGQMNFAFKVVAPELGAFFTEAIA